MRIRTSDWFAVRVKSQTEDVVSGLLAYKGYTTYVPRSGGSLGSRPACRRPVLPGYVFCRAEGEIRGLVLATPYALSVVAFGGVAARIPDEEIERLRVLEASGLPAEAWRQPLDGTRVRIYTGPLAGLEGRLIRRVHRNLFLVSVEILQRSVSVELHSGCIEWRTVANN